MCSISPSLPHALPMWSFGSTAARPGGFGAVGFNGAAAALVAASSRGDLVGAIVSDGGRPDLAGDALDLVCAPTPLIVGGCGSRHHRAQPADFRET